MRKANNIQAWRPASAAEVFPAAGCWFPDLQDLRCFFFGCFHDLDVLFGMKGKGWRSEMQSQEQTSFTIYPWFIFFIGFSLQYNITSSSFLRSLAESYSLHTFPNKNTHPTQPTSNPNLNPNGDATEPSHRSGQERMKYIEKVLGDSAEEHAKLLAKQKKEGGSRGKKTQVVFWKPCFFSIHGRRLSMMWKKVWYWV